MEQVAWEGNASPPAPLLAADVHTLTVVKANLGHERLAVAGLDVALKGVREILRVIRRYWAGQVGNTMVAVGGPPVVEAFGWNGAAD